MMTLDQYKSLIQDFVDEKLPAADFEKEYLAAFKAESGGMESSYFAVLEKLFEDLDAYSPDCRPGEESNFIISEKELRKQAALALDELKRLFVQKHPG